MVQSQKSDVICQATGTILDSYKLIKNNNKIHIQTTAKLKIKSTPSYHS